MTRVQGDVPNQGAHEQRFCPAPLLAFWYKAPAFGKMEQPAETREGSGRAMIESKDGWSIELQPTFVIENYALHCIRAIGTINKERP